MCAAPGSKTAQLIEMIHADEKIPIPGKYIIKLEIFCYIVGNLSAHLSLVMF